MSEVRSGKVSCKLQSPILQALSIILYKFLMKFGYRLFLSTLEDFVFFSHRPQLFIRSVCTIFCPEQDGKYTRTNMVGTTWQCPQFCKRTITQMSFFSNSTTLLHLTPFLSTAVLICSALRTGFCYCDCGKVSHLLNACPCEGHHFDETHG